VYPEIPKAWWFSKEGTEVATSTTTRTFDIYTNWSDCLAMKYVLYRYINGDTDITYPLTWSPTAEFYNLKSDANQAADDYAKYWGINVVYYEAFNFVKYEGAGTHFNIHADHGPAYNCTVSAVIYINDDYEGGDLKFPRLDNLVYKPRVGDIAVFPSNYIYEHASLPMESGTKYCVVIMTDINDLGHKR
jgi:hypothetical protein